MSALMLGLAITMVIAPTGHTSAHKLCPTHLYPFTMAALPPSMASTSPSGHACVQVAQPMHRVESMFGCWALGAPENNLPFSAAARAFASPLLSLWRYRTTGITITIAHNP